MQWCEKQANKWEDQYVVKVEATVAAHIRKKRWEIENLMELSVDVLPFADGTVLDTSYTSNHQQQRKM